MIRVASAGIVGQCGIGRSDRIRAMMSTQKPPGRRTRRTACSVLLRDLLRGSKEFSKSSHHLLLRSRRHGSASFTIRYLFIIVIFCWSNFHHLWNESIRLKIYSLIYRLSFKWVGDKVCQEGMIEHWNFDFRFVSYYPDKSINCSANFYETSRRYKQRLFQPNFHLTINTTFVSPAKRYECYDKSTTLNILYILPVLRSYVRYVRIIRSACFYTCVCVCACVCV